MDNFFVDQKINIVELGSGNGRDAIFFAHHHHNVIAIDQSSAAIKLERQKLDKEISQYLHPVTLDFVSENYIEYKDINAFYSRFTMHSITKNDEEVLLPKIYSALSDDGLFCVEARTINDPLCGIGENCGDNTFINNGHKRRFIDSQIFRDQLSELGFEELYFTEEDNLSIHKDDNPVLMRIISKKTLTN